MDGSLDAKVHVKAGHVFVAPSTARTSSSSVPTVGRKAKRKSKTTANTDTDTKETTSSGTTSAKPVVALVPCPFEPKCNKHLRTSRVRQHLISIHGLD
jgi:hypothetical protein